MSALPDETPAPDNNDAVHAHKTTFGTILIPAGEIQTRVRELGKHVAGDIVRDVATTPGPVIIVPVMTGAMVFTADLIRAMPIDMSIGIVGVTSYPGASTESRGATLQSELPTNLGGAHVLIIDDVLDSGRTLELVHRLISLQSPASLRTCVLLDKPDAQRAARIHADYVGFEIPNVFVVGYGLDFADRFRNFPDVRRLPDNFASSKTDPSDNAP